MHCCQTNSARGFGLIGDWALMTDGQGLILNWYGPSTIHTKIGEVPIALEQTTDYPRTGHIRLSVSPARPIAFPLKLRIPHWSKRTRVSLNGNAVAPVAAGCFLALNHEWKEGDRIEIEFDMSRHYCVGEKDCEGRTSIYRGPILLAYNPKNVPGKIALRGRWSRSELTHMLLNTEEVGAEAEFTFVGNSIRWLGVKDGAGGNAKVKLDGAEVAVLDQYAPAHYFHLS